MAQFTEEPEVTTAQGVGIGIGQRGYEGRASRAGQDNRKLFSPRSLINRILLCGALITATTLLTGLLVSLLTLFFVTHPYIGWGDNVVRDGEAVATGHLQFGNPATQFVGLPYSPIDSSLLAGFLKLYWWQGWEQVISIVAVLVAMASLVRMLWKTTFRVEERLAVASAVVVLALGGLFSIEGFYGEGVDQLAWCLFVVAGALTFPGLLSSEEISVRRMFAVGMLLTASVFTKQITIVPSLLLSVLPLAALVLVQPKPSWSPKRWLRCSTAILTFALASTVVGAALQVASHGFAFDEMVTALFRWARVVPLPQQTAVTLRNVAVPLGATVVLLTAVVWEMSGHPERRQAHRVFVAVAATVIGISSIPTAILAEAKLGGSFNQVAAPVWTLALASTVLLMLLGPSLRELLAVALSCGVLVLSVGPLSGLLANHDASTPDLYQTASWSEIDPFLYSFVKKGEPVYDMAYPSLSVSSSTSATDVQDALASGYTPRLFVRQLLSGRFALVQPFNAYLNGSLLYSRLGYSFTSDVGRYDGSFLWNVDLLLLAGYAPRRDPVSGAVYYQPTSKLKQLGWFANCFGPFRAQAAAVDIRLRGTGGLACIDHGALDLRLAPAATTTFIVRLTDGRGEVRVRFPVAPRTLRITALTAADTSHSPGPSIDQPDSAVARCLTHDASQAGSSLTVTTADSQGGPRCQLVGGKKVLEVPVAPSASSAHISIDVGASDFPSFAATSKSGRPVPFTVLDPTTSDVTGL